MRNTRNYNKQELMEYWERIYLEHQFVAGEDISVDNYDKI